MRWPSSSSKLQSSQDVVQSFPVNSAGGYIDEDDEIAKKACYDADPVGSGNGNFFIPMPLHLISASSMPLHSTTITTTTAPL